MPIFTDTEQGLKRELLDQRPLEKVMFVIGSGNADAYYRLGVKNLYESANSDRAVKHLENAVEPDRGKVEYQHRPVEAVVQPT